jgi:hypothetical protein
MILFHSSKKQTMKRMFFKIKAGPILLIGLFLPLFCTGQVEMPASVLGNGWADLSDGNLQMKGTLAQPLIGVVENAANQKHIGFWYQTRRLLTSVTWVEADAPFFELEQNYPNPAYGLTVVPFSVPRSAEVRMVVINSAGREVGVLVEQTLASGKYQAEWDVSQLPPGVYFYQLFADGLLQSSRRLVVQ